MRKRTIYFDTNSFDHIRKRIGIDSAGLADLRDYLRNDEAELVLSVHDIEEAIGLATDSVEEAQAQLELMRSLATMKRFFKEPKELAEQSVAAVLSGGVPPDPFVSDPERLESGLSSILRGDEASRSDLQTLARVTAGEINSYLAKMKEARDATREDLTEFRRSGAPVPEFSAYFDGARRLLAKGLLEQQNHEATEAEVEELLRMPYPRSYMGAAASLLYAYNFEKREPNRGDLRDKMHAGVAEFADVFVVNDRKLVRILERVPGRGYELTGLEDFVRDIRKRSPN